MPEIDRDTTRGQAMGGRRTIGILTFHRCINYGAWWQASCLVQGLRSWGHDAVLLDYRSWRIDLREWTWGLRPVSPDPIPPGDFFRYAAKEWAFFRASARLPRSRPFRLERPSAMEEFDVVIVGSDEVWSPKHAWYGDCPLFYGAGVRARSLVSYATSFGGHLASEGLDAVRSDRLRAFDAISVRDDNSRALVRQATGRTVPVVLDPCLLFPVHQTPVNQAPLRRSSGPPIVALYGYRFSDWFIGNVRRWACEQGLRIVSIGYRNAWADENWLSAGPDAFAHLMREARAVATNFFHGCVFALRHSTPFVCELLTDRSIKVRDLMTEVGAERHLMSSRSPAAAYDACLGRPLEAAIPARIERLRAMSTAYLEDVLRTSPGA